MCGEYFTKEFENENELKADVNFDVDSDIKNTSIDANSRENGKAYDRDIRRKTGSYSSSTSTAGYGTAQSSIKKEEEIGKEKTSTSNPHNARSKEDRANASFSPK